MPHWNTRALALPHDREAKKAGEFYTPPQISNILSAIVTLDSQEPQTGTRKWLESVRTLHDLALFNPAICSSSRPHRSPHLSTRHYARDRRSLSCIACLDPSA